MSDMAKGKVNQADFVRMWDTVKPKGTDDGTTGGEAGRRLRKKANGKSDQSNTLVDIILSVLSKGDADADASVEGGDGAGSFPGPAGKDRPQTLATTMRRVEQARASFGPVDQDVVDALLSARDNGGKASIHYAAWRGCKQHVETLLACASNPAQLLNLPSQGPHNYGKTPIFYSITQDRNDVVHLLLERGARVKVLNNKGQSVLSLAAAHLTEETVEKIRLAELAEDGGWINFRA